MAGIQRRRLLALMALLCTACGTRVPRAELVAPVSSAHVSPSESVAARPTLPAESPGVAGTGGAALGWQTAIAPVAFPAGAVALLEIPRIGLAQFVSEGIDQGHLARGPGHWPGTALPGHIGNLVVAGHRVTHTHPFYAIDLLGPGDQVIFATRNATFVYEVADNLVVRPSDFWITLPTIEPTMTLFACHPRGSAARRYVVRGRLVSPPAPAWTPAEPTTRGQAVSALRPLPTTAPSTPPTTEAGCLTVVCLRP